MSAAPVSVGSMKMKSIGGREKISAVDGGFAMNNPTATIIICMLNNLHEFPSSSM